MPDFLAPLPERISDVLGPWVVRSPDRPALVEASGAWTYGELAARIRATQQWLREASVRPGDRVMVVGENSRSFVAVLLALAALDAWPVLVNARLSAQEIDQIQEHSGARRSIYCVASSPQAAQHAKRHRAIVAEAAGLGIIGMGPLHENVEPERIDAAPAERVAALIYTSGTTGLPKGVMLTHRNVLFVAAASAAIRSLTPDDRLYGVLPMSHAVGLSVVLLGTLLTGATLYLTARFDPVAALASLEKDRLTVVLGAPSMFSLLVEYMERKNIRRPVFPALRILSSSSAPLPAALKLSVETALGLVLHNGYGVTECSPNIAQTRPASPRSDLSVGRILPGVEIRLVGADGQDVPAGDTGELWVRGPNVMRGYYRSPEETAAAVNPEGWFNTRDLARLAGDHLFIEGRTKELIVRFGLNVYPAEVEAALNTHPAVLRSAVVGRAAEGVAGGEEVVAFVQLAPQTTLTSEDLLKHAAQALAPYKRPSEIILVARMPLTLTGKIMKAELAAIGAANRLPS